jgi:flagellar motor switch protein FliM
LTICSPRTRSTCCFAAATRCTGGRRDPTLREYAPDRRPAPGVHERLPPLDIINERFARYFRMSLFNLIRRSIDITVKSVRYQRQRIFDMPMPTNINLLAMKPLRGTALVVFRRWCSWWWTTCSAATGAS